MTKSRARVKRRSSKNSPGQKRRRRSYAMAWGATSNVRWPLSLLLLLLFKTCAAFGQTQPSALSPEVQSHLAAAQQAQSQQDLATAETEYAAVVKLDPQFAEAHMNLGLVHQLQGREPEAINDFRAALKLKPSLTGANFFLGVDYCKQGKGAEAIPYLKAAVAQQPQQVDMLSWLATAQDLSGQWIAEAATLHRALKVQ